MATWRAVLCALLHGGDAPVAITGTISANNGATLNGYTVTLISFDGSPSKLLFTGNTPVNGGTIYQFDPTEQYCYYYAHLERYAEGLHEGDKVRKGQVIGYVGTSGNAPKNTPHLHFAIFQLGADKRWWQGTAIDPYDVFKGAGD